LKKRETKVSTGGEELRGDPLRKFNKGNTGVAWEETENAQNSASSSTISQPGKKTKLSQRLFLHNVNGRGKIRKRSKAKGESEGRKDFKTEFLKGGRRRLIQFLGKGKA